MIGIRVFTRGISAEERPRIIQASALAITDAFKAQGSVENVKICQWKWHPDAAECKPGDFQQIQIGATYKFKFTTGEIEAAVSVEIFPSPKLAEAIGASNRPLDILIETVGWAGDEKFHSFYRLLDLQPNAAVEVIEEILRRLAYQDVKIKTSQGIRYARVEELIAWIKTSQNYNFDLDNAMPIHYCPWTEQLAHDIYRISPPSYAKLGGQRGMEKVVKNAALPLLKYLQEHYRTRKTGRILQLIPHTNPAPSHHHRELVNTLKASVQHALKTAASQGAKKLLEEKGEITWEDYLREVIKEFKKSIEETIQRRKKLAHSDV